MFTQAEGLCDLVQRLLAHQARAQPRQVPLGQAAESLVQLRRNDAIEDAVAQELEPLVVRRAVTAMRQSLREELGPGKKISDALLKALPAHGLSRNAVVQRGRTARVPLLIAARRKIDHHVDVGEQRNALGIGKRNHEVVALLRDLEILARDDVDVVYRGTPVESLTDLGHRRPSGLCDRHDGLLHLEIFYIGRRDLEAADRDDDDDDARDNHSDQGDASLIPHRMSLSMKFPDAPQFVEIEPDEKRLSYDVLVRHETPDSTVRRVVAVVAHHEIVPRRHGAGYAFAIVVAIFAKGERPGEWDRRGRVALQKDGVLDPAYRLEVLRRIVDSLAIEIVGDLPARLNDAVDREL